MPVRLAAAARVNRATDIAPTIAELRAAGVTSLRAIAARSTNEASAPRAASVSGRPERCPTAATDAGLTTAALPPIRTIGMAFVFRTDIVCTRRDGAHDDAKQQCQSDKTTHGTALISGDEVTRSLCAAVVARNTSCFTAALFIRPPGPRPSHPRKTHPRRTHERDEAIIELVVASAGAGKFAATTPFRNGVLYTSAKPFLDGARVLLAEGTDPVTVLQMRHDGSAMLALRSAVGTAAGLTVLEGDLRPRFGRWQAFTMPALANWRRSPTPSSNRRRAPAPSAPASPRPCGARLSLQRAATSRAARRAGRAVTAAVGALDAFPYALDHDRLRATSAEVDHATAGVHRGSARINPEKEDE
jgi:hypothetical protein